MPAPGSGCRRPIHRPWLLLHHPEPAAPHPAIEIVMERGDIGMGSLLPQGALVVAERKTLGEADWVGVPRRKVQMLGQREVIEVGEETHEIMGDPAARRVAADDVGLHAVVGAHLLGAKRWKSSRAAGLVSVTARFGRATSSKLATSIDQNTVPQATLSSSADW